MKFEPVNQTKKTKDSFPIWCGKVKKWGILYIESNKYSGMCFDTRREAREYIAPFNKNGLAKVKTRIEKRDDYKA